MTSAQFTCISCRVAFKEADLQRLHYKSDWHRYNLKRKVAELPPVSSEQFELKVLNQRNANAVEQQEQHAYCKCCKKSFSSNNAFANHLNSKKHKDVERTYVPVPKSQEAPNLDKAHSVDGENTEDVEFDSHTEELDSDDWWDVDDNPISNNDCIFCTHHSKNFLTNLEHMTAAHSFFVPDIEYCTNLEGLLRYLGEKVSDGFMCLWCNEKGRTFHSADAARKHMVDKGHCKMIHEGVALAEYAEFYDYSTSYPDADGDRSTEDEEVEVPEIDGSDYQMVLPSGATIGHRTLMRYYKQSHNPNSSLVVSKNTNTKKLHKVLATYRALGWTETQQEAAAKKARDIHYLKRLHSKYTMKLGVKNNKLQTHFRQQVNF